MIIPYQVLQYYFKFSSLRFSKILADNPASTSQWAQVKELRVAIPGVASYEYITMQTNGLWVVVNCKPTSLWVVSQLTIWKAASQPK